MEVFGTGTAMMQILNRVGQFLTFLASGAGGAEKSVTDNYTGEVVEKKKFLAWYRTQIFF